MARAVVFVLSGVVASVSPVLAQSPAERQLAAEIRMLEQRTERIEAAIGELAEATQALTKQVADEAIVNRKLSADQTVLLTEAVTAVRVLREQLAETNQRLTAALERPAGQAASSELFENARGDYMTGNYALAIQGFTTYLETSPQAANAPLALYYIGESYRQDRKPDEALAAYDRLIAEHPASEPIPNARVRRAEVLGELGRTKEARAEYETVIKDSPGTDAATIAKQRLATLGR